MALRRREWFADAGVWFDPITRPVCQSGLVPQTWRPTPIARVGCAAVASGFIAFGIFALVESVMDPFVAGFVFTAVCLAVAASFVLTAFGSYVRIDYDGVSYRNLVSTTTIGWSDLRGSKAGYNGISLLRADGTVAVALAVQKSYVARWRCWRTRADEVVDSIEEARRSHG